MKLRDSFSDVLVFILIVAYLAGITVQRNKDAVVMDEIRGERTTAQCHAAELEGKLEDATAELERRPIILGGSEGIASWYGHFEDGRTTASGEVFDMNAMTAAHPTAPFGTVFVVVRVNDRMPKYHKREIDLSYAAALRLGIVKQGLARVRLYEIMRPRPSGGD